MSNDYKEFQVTARTSIEMTFNVPEMDLYKAEQKLMKALAGVEPIELIQMLALAGVEPVELIQGSHYAKDRLSRYHVTDEPKFDVEQVRIGYRS